MTTRTTCAGCGKPRASGGQRYCYACLGQILSEPIDWPAVRESSTTYALPRRKMRCSQAAGGRAHVKGRVSHSYGVELELRYISLDAARRIMEILKDEPGRP